jgi:periplasmic protein TonB
MSNAVARGGSAAHGHADNSGSAASPAHEAGLSLSLASLSLDEHESLGSRLTRYAVVAAFHAGVLALVLTIEPRLVRNLLPGVLNVRTIVEEPPEPPKPEIIPPKPLPQAKSVTRKQVAPPPVMTAASNEPAPASFAVAPQPPPAPLAPPAPPAPSAPVAAAPAAVPVTAARFDADYLKNPPPAYPALSRRMREEGKVLLLVQVSAKGLATDVRIRQSSGFSRLDDAALEAVRQWHFVPAKRGDEAIAASVIVPILFRIE